MNDDIVEIDFEHIRMLKRTGRYLEAMDLIDAWQNAGKKNIKEGKEINKKINKKVSCFKRRIRLKKEGKCTDCAKPKEPERMKNAHCLKCAINHRSYSE